MVDFVGGDFTIFADNLVALSLSSCVVSAYRSSVVRQVKFLDDVQVAKYLVPHLSEPFSSWHGGACDKVRGDRSTRDSTYTCVAIVHPCLCAYQPIIMACQQCEIVKINAL